MYMVAQTIKELSHFP